MANMTKEELANKVAELEAALAIEKAKSVSIKTRIEEALHNGVNNMDDLANVLGTGKKSLSSNLTRLRKEFIATGKTIITQQHNGKTMIAIVSLETLGWVKKTETTEIVKVEAENVESI